MRFGERLKLRLPAKRVPEAVERWIRHYESDREEGETWSSYVARVGTATLEAQVKDLSMPVDFGLDRLKIASKTGADYAVRAVRLRADGLARHRDHRAVPRTGSDDGAETPRIRR